MANFNQKTHYPYPYGDKNANEVRLSDFVIELMKSKKFQRHLNAVFFALGSYAKPSSVIPPEYG